MKRQLSGLLVAGAMAALSFAGPPPAAAQDSSAVELLDKSAKAFSQVVKDVKPAVVYIAVQSTAETSSEYEEFFNHPFFERFFGPEFRRFQDPNRRRQQRGAGSGFIIDEQGYILTNHHVVDNADEITVTLADKTEVDGELIGTDPKSDVALIKIDVDRKLPTVELGDSEALEVGEWVIAIGNPFGLSQTVTVGVVSATGRSRVGINEYENFIQTDAAINPGNSGGPLLNIRGEAVGINSALYSRTGGYMGIGFAIPINMATNIKEQLLTSGKVTRGYLGVGIQDVDESLAESFGLDKAGGVLITEVQPDTPAEEAGIERQDVILKLDDTEITDTQDLRNRIAQTSPGTEVNITVSRDGKPVELAVTIGEQPADFGRVARPDPAGGPLYPFGLALQELTPDLAEQFGFEGREGLIVSEVVPGSPAAEAGLRPGMLIEEVEKQTVASLDELRRVLEDSQVEDRVLIRVRFGEGSRYVVLKKD